MRLFLQKFFARHFLQVQTCLLEHATSDEFVRSIQTGRIRVLDIGAGPAVLGLALAEMIECLMATTRHQRTWHTPFPISIDMVLNDSENICISTGKHLLKDYFNHGQRDQGVHEGVIVDVSRKFPANMTRLAELAARFGGFDLISLSYVVKPIVESQGIKGLLDAIVRVGRLATHNARLLILQDKFQEELMSTIAAALGTTLYMGESYQEIYPIDVNRSEYTYSFFYCLYDPHNPSEPAIVAA